VTRSLLTKLRVRKGLVGALEGQQVILRQQKYALKITEKDCGGPFEARKISLALKGLPYIKKWSLRKLILFIFEIDEISMTY